MSFTRMVYKLSPSACLWYMTCRTMLKTESCVCKSYTWSYRLHRFQNWNVFETLQVILRDLHTGNTTCTSTVTHSRSETVQRPETASHGENLIVEKALPLRKMPGPPGLKRLPYIGALLLFWPFSDYRPETYGQLVMTLHQKYGPIFKTRLGQGYTVHTASLEDMEKVFDGDGIYPQRRLMMLSRKYRERKGLPQALGCVNGPEWHALRKPLNVLLNRPQATFHYLPAQCRVANDFVSKLAQLGRHVSAQDIYELFFKFSAESIGVVCFNARLGLLSADLHKDEAKSRLLDAFHTSLNCTFKAIIGLERRYLITDRDTFYQKYARAMDYIREQSTVYVQKVMDDVKRHDAKSESSRTDDPDLEEDSPNLLASLVQKSELDMEQILAIIDSLLIAGSDSTARNLSVLLYNLAKHPEVQQRAADEVRNLLDKDGPVTAGSLGKLNYLKACVKESMRLNFPIPTGPERILSRDLVLSGYLVPRGTSVIISTNKTSLDPDIFPEPHTYKPERWMRTETKIPRLERDSPNQSLCPNPSSLEVTSSQTSQAEVNGGFHTCQSTNQPDIGKDFDIETQAGTGSSLQSGIKELRSRQSSFAFLPFGHGPRSCIGRRFAEMELYVCLAKLLQKLEVEVDPSYKELKTIYTPFITPVDPIPFRFKERK